MFVCVLCALHTHKSKTKSLAAAKQSRRPSDPALGYLGTTQVLGAGASNFTWGRASTPQVEQHVCTHTTLYNINAKLHTHTYLYMHTNYLNSTHTYSHVYIKVICFVLQEQKKVATT